MGHSMRRWIGRDSIGGKGGGGAGRFSGNPWNNDDNDVPKCPKMSTSCEIVYHYTNALSMPLIQKSHGIRSTTEVGAVAVQKNIFFF
jgi:hypothetical protein